MLKIDWIDNKLGVSGAIDNYNLLEKENIKAVINVRAELHDDMNELTKRMIQYYWIPIPDWSGPRSAQIRLFIDLVDNIKGKVLVHK